LQSPAGSSSNAAGKRLSKHTGSDNGPVPAAAYSALCSTLSLQVALLVTDLPTRQLAIRWHADHLQYANAESLCF
jgi:hypothetical protein